MENEKVNNSIEENERVRKFLVPTLIVQLVRGAIKGLIERWVLQLIIFIVVFLTILFANTYLIVVVNEGFSIGNDNPYLSITALGNQNISTYFTATMFWVSTVILIFSVISRIRARGVTRFFKDLIESPSWLLQSIKEVGPKWMLPFMYGGLLSLALGFIIQNRYTLGVMAFFIFLSFTAKHRSGLLQTAILIIIDWRRFWKIEEKKKFIHVANLTVALFGFFIGFLLDVVLPFKPISTIILIILSIVLIIFGKTNKLHTKTAMFLLSFAITATFLLKLNVTYADDGGWKEGGGNLKDWAESPGAKEAVEKGAGTSVLGGIFGFFTSLLSGTAQNLLPGPPPAVAGPGVLDILSILKDIGSADSPREAQKAAFQIFEKVIPGPLGGDITGAAETIGDMTSYDPVGDAGGSGGGGRPSGAPSGGFMGEGHGKERTLPDFDPDAGGDD